MHTFYLFAHGLSASLRSAALRVLKKTANIRVSYPFQSDIRFAFLACISGEYTCVWIFSYFYTFIFLFLYWNIFKLHISILLYVDIFFDIFLSLYFHIYIFCFLYWNIFIFISLYFYMFVFFCIFLDIVFFWYILIFENFYIFMCLYFFVYIFLFLYWIYFFQTIYVHLCLVSMFEDQRTTKPDRIAIGP